MNATVQKFSSENKNVRNSLAQPMLQVTSNSLLLEIECTTQINKLLYFFSLFFLPEDSEILHKLKLSSIYKKNRSVLNKSEAAAVRSMCVNIFTICL